MNQMTGYSRIFGGKLQIDGGALKMIAVVTMFIDHLTLCFLEVVKGPDGRAILYSIPYGKVLDRIGRGIGRTAFPIFCFMVVEALIYTRSRVSYLVRMLLFAAISHYPFNWMIFSGSEKIHCNLFRQRKDPLQRHGHAGPGISGCLDHGCHGRGLSGTAVYDQGIQRTGSCAGRGKGAAGWQLRPLR